MFLVLMLNHRYSLTRYQGWSENLRKNADLVSWWCQIQGLISRIWFPLEEGGLNVATPKIPNCTIAVHFPVSAKKWKWHRPTSLTAAMELHSRGPRCRGQVQATQSHNSSFSSKGSSFGFVSIRCTGSKDSFATLRCGQDLICNLLVNWLDRTKSHPGLLLILCSLNELGQVVAALFNNHAPR